jgi:hypothetical protein
MDLSSSWIFELVAHWVSSSQLTNEELCEERFKLRRKEETASCVGGVLS